MDYIYGQLNIPSKIKVYEGKDTDYFRTKICEVLSGQREMSVYLLINELVNSLEIVYIKCSEQSLCSNNLIVGTRAIRCKTEYMR